MPSSKTRLTGADPRLAPTKPDIRRARPLEDSLPPPVEKQGGARDGRYSFHFGRKRRKGLQKLVDGLSSVNASERTSSARALKEYAADADKAREVSSLLPADSAGYRAVETVREHCLRIIGKELR
jgi:hypothetical protein